MEPLTASEVANARLEDNSPGSPGSEGSQSVRVGFVFFFAMVMRMAHKINDMNPTTAQSHDGQFQGVTPLVRLNFSDSL